MFERFTESARRTLFYARYEVSETGGGQIETEHILLGLLRENKGPIRRIFQDARLSYGELHHELYASVAKPSRLKSSVEIPFTLEMQRVLNGAASEADALHHSYIGTEHLLLALLREESSAAARILMRRGLTLEATRGRVARLIAESGAPPSDETRPYSELIDPRATIDRIWDEFLKLQLIGEDNEQARTIIARIARDLDALKKLLE